MFYIAFLFICKSLFAQVPVNANEREDEAIYQKVDALISEMTLEEKVGQMTNISLMAIAEGDFWNKRDTVILDTAKMRDLLGNFHVGSVQNLGTYPFSPREWRQNIEIIQDYVKSQTRLKIPVLYAIDAVHGANYSAGSTLFPHQLGMAATWSRDLVEKGAAITSYEIRASGIPMNYAPVLDACKQPLWGRIFETFGEDTYLTSQLGLATIKGAQGDNLSNPYSSFVCLKHFLAYGAPTNGKDRSPVNLSYRKLRQDYLPPFRAAIDAGALAIMISSAAINGIPSHADEYLITKLLKQELGFRGFTISDWEDVSNLVKTHQVAATEKEAVMLAVNAGLDMCMEPYDASFASDLIELVNEGAVKTSRIDDAVRRILYVKFKIGLFDTIQTDSDLYMDYGSPAFAESSYNAAAESITLLKNTNSQLPLGKNEKVLVTGVASNSLNYLNGAWSRTWSGVDTTFNDWGKETILEAIQNTIGRENSIYAQGTSYDSDVNTKQAIEKAAQADRIIICLGEIPATEKPSDIDALDFPNAQINLVKQLAATGKPITLVLVEARPRIIREIEPLAESILMAYLPGNEGGRAIADVLYGVINPSGKLPITYPKYNNSLWAYDHTRADERDKGFGYDAFDPQYAFGFGLSYTDFAYSDLKISNDTLFSDDSLFVSVKVTNIGSREGKEIVQLYSADQFASIVPTVKQLRRFEKINLQPAETKTVQFSLHPKDLAFVNAKNEWITEPGAFTLMIDTLEVQFLYQESSPKIENLPETMTKRRKKK